jgi:hypothetical protein
VGLGWVLEEGLDFEWARIGEMNGTNCKGINKCTRDKPTSEKEKKGRNLAPSDTK